MSRKEPTNNPPAVRSDELAGWVKLTRKYKVITPLFGGGEETQKADSISVVRATELRGHLRFWWRATRGGAFGGDLNEMKEAEEKIWGSSATKDKAGQSKVIVMVKNENRGIADHPFEVRANAENRPQIRARSGSLAQPYAAFPLQPEQQEAHVGMETKAVLNNVTFTLEIQFSNDAKPDVEAALWAWEYFGGIGARTRRGFGAIQCIESNGIPITPQSSTEVENYLKDQIKSILKNGEKWHAGVPHLGTNPKHVKVTARRNNNSEAGSDLINALKNFRQLRRDGNGRNRPGRSYWPEPEAIRETTDQRHPDHQPLPNSIKKFPRAKFGLPIIFHFKD